MNERESVAEPSTPADPAWYEVDTVFSRERTRWREWGLSALPVQGVMVVVPEAFSSWPEHQRRGYLAQRRVYAAEGELVTFAHSTVGRLEAATDSAADPWEVAGTEISAAMALSTYAATKLVTTAMELCRRLPRTAALLIAGWIGLQSAHLIAAETRLVDDDKIAALDALIAANLGPSRRRTHPPRMGPLRKMLGRAVNKCDPVAAAARAREERTNTGVDLDRMPHDQTLLTATLSADDGVEIMERVEAMARTAGPDDERTLGQRRAAGLLALCRGWTCLPAPDGSHPEDPEAEKSVRKVVLHAYEVDGQTSLAGYGVLTRETAEKLERAGSRRTDHIEDLADRDSFQALRYSPSEALRVFCRGRDGTCVFPGCQIEAEKCELDHIVPYDHADPARGGRTTSDDLADLCGRHHRLKTEGIWAYYRDVDGTYVWIHGPAHPDPDPAVCVRVEPTGPLAMFGTPWDQDTAGRHEAAARAGRTGDNSAPGGAAHRRKRPHLRERRDAERRRLRNAAPPATSGADAGAAGGTDTDRDDPPPF